MTLGVRGSFQLRLAASFVLSVLVTCLILSLAAYLIIREIQFSNVRNAAVRHSQVALQLMRETLPAAYDEERIPAEVIRALGLYVRERSLEILVVTEAGTYSSTPRITAADIPSDLAGDQGVDVGKATVRDTPFLVSRASQAAIDAIGVPSIDGVFVFNSLAPSLRSLNHLARTLLIVSVLVVVSASLLGRLVARRILRPVVSVSEAAQDLAAGILSRRAPAQRGDEFEALVNVFNQMAESLEHKIAALARSEERERRFAAAVAHDLHSAVSALSLEAESLSEQSATLPEEAREFAELIASDIGRLTRLTSDLIEIARIDAGQTVIEAEWIELRTLLQDLSWERRWRNHVHVSGPVQQIYSDRRMLKSILANLIENALKYGGGEAWVEISKSREARLVVRDQGPGLSEADRQGMFERFYRGQASSSVPGGGLGLALVAEYAASLGIDIAVQSHAGKGTAVSLKFETSRRQA